MPNPAEVYALSAKFRNQAIRRERQVANQLVDYYGNSWQNIKKTLNALTSKIDAIKATGVEPSVSLIMQQSYYNELLVQVEKEIKTFAQFADDKVTAAQTEAIAAAINDSRALVDASLPVAIDDLPKYIGVSWNHLDIGAVEHLAGFLADGSPLSKLITDRLPNVVDGVKNTLINGIINGDSPRVVAKALRDDYGMPLTSALRMSRTETLRAYRSASLQSYRANSDVVKGWTRHAADDACLACEFLDGEEYELEEEMDDHISGRCSALPRTLDYADLGLDVPPTEGLEIESGYDRFMNLSEDEQRNKLDTQVGQGAYQAWKDGKYDLKDIPKHNVNETWGNSWTVSSKKDLFTDEE